MVKRPIIDASLERLRREKRSVTARCSADNANATFMGLIDLTSAGLEEVNMLARRKQWKEAMAAYVAIFRRKLKMAQLPPLPGNPRYMEDAELLLL